MCKCEDQWHKIVPDGTCLRARVRVCVFVHVYARFNVYNHTHALRASILAHGAVICKWSHGECTGIWRKVHVIFTHRRTYVLTYIHMNALLYCTHTTSQVQCHMQRHVQVQVQVQKGSGELAIAWNSHACMIACSFMCSHLSMLSSSLPITLIFGTVALKSVC